MPTTHSSPATAANELTARWATDACDGGNAVVAGAGIWPLLAILAASASGDARAELEAATGISGDGGFEAAAELMETLNESPATSAALGVWVKNTLPLHQAWRDNIPADIWAELAGDGGDEARLNAWASRQTDGLIEKMPVTVNDDTLMVLATALMVRTKWQQRFEGNETGQRPFPARSGPWKDRVGIESISRHGTRVDDVALVSTASAGSLTVASVRGDDDIVVHLAISDEDHSACSVVGDLVRTVGAQDGWKRGSEFVEGEVGPGLTVRTVNATDPATTLWLTTVAFRVESDHDLLESAGLFGLETASDSSRGHFPGMSSEPLAVQQARQTAMAAFTDKGFEAAAVTAVGMMLGRAMRRDQVEALRIDVRFDRPFAFACVHEPTGLVLCAGWVADPVLDSAH